MKRLFLFFIFSLGIYVTNATVALAYSYPISELGNCRDQKECRLYCEIPKNHASCWSYRVYGSKDNVLGDESPEQQLKEQGISFPIEELGNCGSVAACKAYCEKEENQSACQSYAGSHGLKTKERLVEKAKEELGCSTVSECKTLCEKEENRDKCQNFAKRFHLKTTDKSKLLETAKEKLGCTSEQTCRELCAKPENHEKCQDLAKKFQVTTQKREELKRSGECSTIEECRKFCQSNPDKCPGFPKRNDSSEK